MQAKAAEPATGKGKKRKAEQQASAEFSADEPAASAEQPAAGQNVPAFVLTKHQRDLVTQRLASITAEGHVPKNWTSPAVESCFDHPSYLRAHDWLLLAGPLGRYALQGILPPAMEAILFQYMEFLEKLTAKEFSLAVLPKL